MPFLLALYENQNLTKQQYGELFEELTRMIGCSGLTLCSIVIDNLPAQSAGLDEILSRSESPIIHIRYFAHMANLVLVNSLATQHFERVMTALTEDQAVLHKAEARAEIG
jgi:hypothetical protein